MQDKGLLRIIDANFNRCKEGLRVVEDVLRFAFEDDSLRKKVRKVRHSLDWLSKDKDIKSAILSRDSKRDLGRGLDFLELKRASLNDVLYINFQRVKESLRVLEEIFKLTRPRFVSNIKKLRYEIYNLEKNTLKKWPPLSDS